MTTKRNTVSITLEDEDYDALKALAGEQDRYISGQARHMLRGELKRLSGAQEPLNGIRKFTGVVVPDEMLGQDDSTQPEGPHANASAKQEPLPG